MAAARPIGAAGRPRRGRSRRSRARPVPSGGRGPSRSSAHRRSRSGRPDGPSARRRSRSTTKPRPDDGGVSRPSSRAWMRDLGDAFATGQLGQRDDMAVVGMDAARADEADDMEDARPSRARAQAARKAGRSKNEPSAMAASIRGRSWRTGPARAEVQVPDLRVAHLARRQADRLLGRARARSCGQLAEQARHVGIGAAAIGVGRRDRARCRSHRGRPGRWDAAGRGRHPRHAGRAAGRGGQARHAPRSRPSRRA